MGFSYNIYLLQRYVFATCVSAPAYNLSLKNVSEICLNCFYVFSKDVFPRLNEVYVEEPPERRRRNYQFKHPNYEALKQEFEKLIHIVRIFFYYQRQIRFSQNAFQKLLTERDKITYGGNTIELIEEFQTVKNLIDCEYE